MENQRHFGDPEVPLLTPRVINVRAEPVPADVTDFEGNNSDRKVVSRTLKKQAKERYRLWRQRLLRERARHWQQIHTAERARRLFEYLQLARLGIGAIKKEEGERKSKALSRKAARRAARARVLRRLLSNEARGLKA